MRIPAAVCAGTVLIVSGVAAQGPGLKIERSQGVLTLSNEGKPRPRPTVSRTVPQRSRAYDPLIDRHARRTGLDADLVRAVIQVESAFDPSARSRKGALGLMQLLPGTARELGVRDVFDPEENIRGGTDYLRRMLDRFGRVELALAGYNAGPGAVERHGGIPPYRETRDYVSKVLGLYQGQAWSGAPVRVGRPVEITRGPDDTIRLVTRD